jgi:hypothetical protein
LLETDTRCKAPVAPSELGRVFAFPRLSPCSTPGLKSCEPFGPPMRITGLPSLWSDYATFHDALLLGHRQNDDQKMKNAMSESFRTYWFPPAMGTVSPQRDRPLLAGPSERAIPGATPKPGRQKMAPSHHRAMGSVWSVEYRAVVRYPATRRNWTYGPHRRKTLWKIVSEGKPRNFYSQSR